MKKLTLETDELAEVLRLTGRHVRRLVADKVLPEPVDGQHDVVKAVTAYITHIRHDSEGKKARAELNVATTKLRIAQLRRMLATMLTPEESRERAMEIWAVYWSAWNNGCATLYYSLPAEWPEMQRRSLAEGIRMTGVAYIQEQQRELLARSRTLPEELANPERVERLLADLTDAEDDAP